MTEVGNESDSLRKCIIIGPPIYIMNEAYDFSSNTE